MLIGCIFPESRGLMNVEEVPLPVLRLENYIKISHQLLLTVARKMYGDFGARNVKPVIVAKENRHNKLK